VPPLALMILERWFLGSQYLAQWIFGHLQEMLPAAFQPASSLKKFSTGQGEGLIAPNLALFAEPAIWGGIIIAALFVTAAIWIRRYRDET
jgi:hypothetical protein